MKIASYLNTSKEEVDAKKFNIFLGISLGKKYFIKENLKQYLLWALDNTKEKVGILIPDKLHAINYEVKNKYSPERAGAVAYRKGQEIATTVQELIKEFPLSSRSVIEILYWEEIEDEEYRQMLNIVNEAFKTNLDFRNLIIDTVKEAPNFDQINLTSSDHERLAKYVLDELPILIAGIRKGNVHYQLLPYPGMAKIDFLALDLQEGKTFPEITRELGNFEKLRLIEAYAD